MNHGPALGDLQLAILKSLWRRERAAVTEVHDDLQAAHGSSASTIGTMLQKMERRGLVGHDSDGRRYLYFARVTESEVRRSQVGDLLRRMFGGDPKALVGHLVREEELQGVDLDGLLEDIERAAAKDPTDEEADA